MCIDPADLLKILRIGHDTSMRGQGMSLKDALLSRQYASLRRQFDSSDLVPLLRADPELIKQWLAYCEDKRTSSGFWISDQSFEVGSLDAPECTLRFGSLEEAVAEFVVRELDFWSAVGRRRRSGRG